MTLKVWLRQHGPCDSAYASGLAAALAKQDVEVVARGESATAVGLVLFSGFPEDLGALIENCSRHGLDRVVAVAIDEDEIPGGLAWPLLRRGACDVLGGRDLGRTSRALLCRAERWAAIEQLMALPSVSECLIGRSPLWVHTLRDIVETAAFTDGSLLLLGESGTGKELIARMVHALDRRSNKRSLVVLDCTTVVPELSGSEFFGHERGAFTGASAARDGSFALAEGGTLFLDEVGELPLPLQAQLLRVIQERCYKRVGSNEWLRANFRLVAATNRKLDEEVNGGSFRRDLFHRIASRVFHIPPLRERTEDVLLLAQHFFSQLRPQQPVVLDSAVREYLLSRVYPGNVRELRQLIHRMNDRWVGEGPVSVGAIPLDELPGATASPAWKGLAFDQVIWRALELRIGLQEIKEAASTRAFALALEMDAGSTRAAASRLAVTERTVQMYRAECKNLQS